jgi:hypothetical protein
VFTLGRRVVGPAHAAIAILLMAGISAFTVPTLEFGQSVLAMPPPDLQGGYGMPPGQDLYWAPPTAYPDGQMPPGYAYPYYGSGPGRYPAAGPPVPCNSDEPDFYVDLGFVLLWQENTFSNGLALNFDPGAGPRVLIGIRPTPDNAVELEYFGSFGNEIDGRLRTDDLSEPVLQLQYTSDLQNAEVNLIHWWDQFALLFRDYLRTHPAVADERRECDSDHLVIHRPQDVGRGANRADRASRHRQHGAAQPSNRRSGA